MSSLTLALAGNPNAGKTTIFNNLTGARHHVGNYPGVTVEKKEATIAHNGRSLRIVDMPGTYSLTANSLEERVARDFLIDEQPDVVVQILDASCLERNLFLSIQLLELEQNLVLCLNMTDVAQERGFSFDLELLSELLGVPIIETIGSKGIGMETLLETAITACDKAHERPKVRIQYSRDLGDEIQALATKLAASTAEPEALSQQTTDAVTTPPLRWIAIKLLEQDSAVRELVRSNFDNGVEIIRQADAACTRLESLYGDPSDILIADRRYGFISGACQEAVKLTVESRHEFSDRLDDILAHRVLGIPIFLAVIYAIFWVTFTVGEWPMAVIEQGVGWLSASVSALWPKGSESDLRSLLVDGIIGGVGGVVIFLPNIVLLFMGISFLEDTGYIARAAFLTDWMMHRIGLHGRSFIPMVVGFGCSVPGIMATRTLESRRDRLTTMLVLPLMSCSARFPIYTLVIPAFFAPAHRAPVLWFLYLFGVLLAVLLAKVLRSTILAGEAMPFVMELPIYRLPTARGVLIHMWERAKLYLMKAGTIILGASIILWLAQSYPKLPQAARVEATARAAAETEYMAAVDDLGTMLVKEPERKLLVRFLRAEHQFQQAKEQYYPHDPAFRAAKKRFAELTASLGSHPRKDFLEEFRLVRDKLMAAREEYAALLAAADEELAGLDTRTMIMARLVLRNSTAKLEQEHKTAYAIAQAYVDDIEAPYQRQLTKAKTERSGAELEHSIAGRVGSFLEPLFKPIGFDHRITTAMLGAFAAKEIFVAQMGIVAAVDTASEGMSSLRSWLQQRYRPLVGLSILLFSLIATPCMATVAVTVRESGSWKWACLQLFGLTAIAYVICLVVYQVGSLLGY